MASGRARVHSLLEVNSVGFAGWGKLSSGSRGLCRDALLTSGQLRFEFPSFVRGRTQGSMQTLPSPLLFPCRLYEAGERWRGEKQGRDGGSRGPAYVSRTLSSPAQVYSNPLWTVHVPPSQGIHGHDPMGVLCGADPRPGQQNRLLLPIRKKRTGQPAQAL